MRKITLSKAVDYTSERISAKEISIDNFITTDNMLQDKAGVTRANYAPAGTMPAFKAGDILVANIRPYLKKIWFATFDGGCSADVLVFKVKEGYVPKFVYYAMLRDDFFAHMMKGAKGTKMPRGDKSQTLEFLIPDFDYTTQQQIAAVLSSLDAKISINNRINTELESMAKTLYDYWFVQFNFPDANGKPYKTSGGTMDYNPEVKREIPVGWEIDSLWHIATYTNGLAMQKYRPEEGADSLRVIKIREMNDGFSANTEFARADVPEKVRVYNGDVLFSWSASLEVMIWTKGIGALNQHIFKVTSEEYPKSFFYFQLVNYLRHFKMMAANRKTTMGHITQEHLQQSRIVLPPHALTLALEEKLEPIFQQMLNNDLQNQQLTELRDWLLPMLMNGQVTVAEAEESVAMAAEPEVNFGKQGIFNF